MVSPLLRAVAALCLCACTLGVCAGATANPAWEKMVAALARRRGYVQFLLRLQAANAIANFEYRQAVTWRGKIPTTIFAVPDSVFAHTAKFQKLWNSRKCRTDNRPTCLVPLTSFLIFSEPGGITLAKMQKAAANTYWNSWQGDGLQKFASPRSKYGFILGPQRGCGGQCAPPKSKLTGGALITPNIYVAPGIIVHSLGALPAPPSVWPNGFY